MKFKPLYIFWVSLPIIMLILIIIASITGEDTTSIWNLFIWVLLVPWLQLMYIIKEKSNMKLQNIVSVYEKLEDTYKEMTSDLENRLKKANSKLQDYVTGGKKEIWNIIIQSFDKMGEEEHYSIDSFVTESLARDKYHAWLEEDRANPNLNVEETPGVLEYWYTRKSGEMTRVKVVKSYVFDSLE